MFKKCCVAPDSLLRFNTWKTRGLNKEFYKTIRIVLPVITDISESRVRVVFTSQNL